MTLKNRFLDIPVSIIALEYYGKMYVGIVFEDNVNQDQTAQNVQSDLGLLCPLFLCCTFWLRKTYCCIISEFFFFTKFHLFY